MGSEMWERVRELFWSAGGSEWNYKTNKNCTPKYI